MRILKHKVKLEALNVKIEEGTGLVSPNHSENERSRVCNIIRKKIKKEGLENFIPKKHRDGLKKSEGSKNIVKNYGKAMSTFAISELAQDHLTVLLNGELAQREKFHEFVIRKKESLDSIDSLREMLIGDEFDSSEEIAFKNIFRHISEIFLKYYAVNWIYGGKLTHKKAHLKYRFKMLRRVRMPHLFTYLKN